MWKILVLIAATLVVFLAAFYFIFIYDSEPQEPPPDVAIVTKAIDGITVRIDTGHRIRFIGSYLPDEDSCFGDKSFEANKNLVGKKIRMEIDPLLTRSSDKAWVRYAFIFPDEKSEDEENEEEKKEPKEIFINEKIIELGYGFPLLSGDMVYGERIMSAARYARATGRGLWGQCEVIKNEQGVLKTEYKEESEEKNKQS